MGFKGWRFNKRTTSAYCFVRILCFFARLSGAGVVHNRGEHSFRHSLVLFLSTLVLLPHLHRAPQRGEPLPLCCMAGGPRGPLQVKAAQPQILNSITLVYMEELLCASCGGGLAGPQVPMKKCSLCLAAACKTGDPQTLSSGAQPGRTTLPHKAWGRPLRLPLHRLLRALLLALSCSLLPTSPSPLWVLRKAFYLEIISINPICVPYLP